MGDACINCKSGYFRSVYNDYCIFYNKVINKILQ